MSCRGEGRHAGGGRHSAVPRRAHAARHKASGGPFTRRGAGLCVLRAVRRSIFSRSRLRRPTGARTLLSQTPCAPHGTQEYAYWPTTAPSHRSPWSCARPSPSQGFEKRARPAASSPSLHPDGKSPVPQRPFGRRGRGCFLSFILRCARFFALSPFSAWYKAGCPGTGYTARRTHCCAWHRRPGSHRWG